MSRFGGGSVSSTTPRRLAAGSASSSSHYSQSQQQQGPQSQRGPHKWSIDNGTIVDFDVKTLRDDVLFRLESGYPVYTVEECRLLLVELTRVATKWQEEELASLLYLSDLHTKLFPNQKLSYQWPLTSTPVIPSSSLDVLQTSPTYKISKVVEELNRGIVRMIDRLWNDRRERLLFAARILNDIEPVVQNAPTAPS